MSMLVSFVLSFFPRDVLDGILNLIGSVSEGFPSYSFIIKFILKDKFLYCDFLSSLKMTYFFIKLSSRSTQIIGKTR